MSETRIDLNSMQDVENLQWGVRQFQNFFNQTGGRENYGGDFAKTVDNLGDEIIKSLNEEDMKKFIDGKWDEIEPILYMWERYREVGTVSIAPSGDDRAEMENFYRSDGASKAEAKRRVDEEVEEIKSDFRRDFIDPYFTHMEGDDAVFR